MHHFSCLWQGVSPALTANQLQSFLLRFLWILFGIPSLTHVQLLPAVNDSWRQLLPSRGFSENEFGIYISLIDKTRTSGVASSLKSISSSYVIEMQIHRTSVLFKLQRKKRMPSDARLEFRSNEFTNT